ncbi:hypothetical protein ACVWXR_002172 [Pseudomonas lurida]|uniref:endonuclease NucS domain-containing protein n=1 Tax=Pseudomonas palleroniana TaxID=191390 RepID=UPI001FD006D6|nr:endonuclease NucS domain-containing protein [Pseudomonas palleroniana]UOP09129.1 endonuclease NucS [Pseudomonas palleroniana]
MGIPMRSPKQYLVVEVSAEGTIEFHPMKNWCRANPTEAPPLNPNEANSQALRRGFERLGWTVEETDTQIRFFKPGTTQSALEVLGETDPDLDQLDTPEGERETVFELEYQLRDFIAHNIESLKVDGKSLRLYVDDQGRDGIEYPTGVGPIDILAIDSDGSYVVFELKRGRVADKAIGQISRYMGWLITNREEGTKVKGVIVAKDISQNLRHAVVAVPNVSLFEYHISFTLNEIKAANAR